MLIVANWKAYIADIKKAKTLLTVSKRLARTTNVTLVLAPPAPLLGALSIGNTSKVAFSAQDFSTVAGGASTGEITASTYAGVGATYALVGHSEQRARGDTNGIVAEKLACALAHGLVPILCIGEHERDSEGRYLVFVREELTTALELLTPKERTSVIVAYEPLWAIGKTASVAISASDLQEMVLYIRKVLAELLSERGSSSALILYGGSVEPENIRSLADGSSVDGFLIGHASVDATLFAKMVTQLA